METFVIFVTLIYLTFCVSFMCTVLEDEIHKLSVLSRILLTPILCVVSPLVTPFWLGITIAYKLK